MRETRLNEAQPALDGSSKLKLIWSNKASYARGHPYTVLHPGTMHASTLLLLLLLLLLRAIAHSSRGFNIIWFREVSPAAHVWCRPDSVWIQTSSTIGLIIRVRPSCTGCLIITLVDCRLSLWRRGGERLTHLTVAVNDLQVSFGPRCLSRSGDFHARF